MNQISFALQFGGMFDVNLLFMSKNETQANICASVIGLTLISFTNDLLFNGSLAKL